jgi:hypothetical protein
MVKIKSSRSRPAQFSTSDGSGEPLFGFWTPQRLVALQLTKLLNYYKDDLDSRWGGYAGIEPRIIDAEFVRSFVELSTNEQPGPWLKRPNPALPWGPDNFAFCHDPWDGFGKPYEPYLSIGGKLFQLDYVSDVIHVDEQELIALKLWLLLDQLVIAEAVKGMLRPPPSWPDLPKSKRRPSVKPTYQAP